MTQSPYTPPSHAQAASAYGSATAAVDQRSLEAHALLNAASKLEMLMNRIKGGESVDFREVGETLDFNQKLWTLFVSDAADPSHNLPQDLKNNIASLGMYVFKRTLDIKADARAEKFNILISINRNIAAGLMKRASSPTPPPAPPVEGGGKSFTESA